MKNYNADLIMIKMADLLSNAWGDSPKKDSPKKEIDKREYLLAKYISDVNVSDLEFFVSEPANIPIILSYRGIITDMMLNGFPYHSIVDVIQLGVDLNYQTDMGFPLGIALKEKKPLLIKTLLNWGADPSENGDIEEELVETLSVMLESSKLTPTLFTILQLFEPLVSNYKRRLSEFPSAKQYFKSPNKFKSESSHYHEEYGDISDYNEPDDPEESNPNYKGFSASEFAKAKDNLLFMGAIDDTASDNDVLSLLENHPKILLLTPKINVKGRWCHTIRQTDSNKLEKAMLGVSKSQNEICVTDASSKEFWDFSEYRCFALVFEGICKFIWNADMYSTHLRNELITDKKMLGSITHINKMTEGWIVPAECTLVGIKVRENVDSQNAWQVFNICKYYNLELNTDDQLLKKQLKKQVVDSEFYNQDEVDKLEQIKIDYESPEHLYEKKHEDYKGLYYEQGSHLDFYNNQLDEAIKNHDSNAISVALYNGANPDRFLHSQIEDQSDPNVALMFKDQLSPYLKFEMVYKIWQRDHNPSVIDAYPETINDVTKEAIHAQDLSLLNLLFNKGVNPNDWFPMIVSSNNLNILELAFKYGLNPNTALGKKVFQLKYKNIPLAKLFLSNGFDVNSINPSKDVLDFLQLSPPKMIIGK